MRLKTLVLLAAAVALVAALWFAGCGGGESTDTTGIQTTSTSASTDTTGETGTTTETSEGGAADGQAIFAANCSPCHGPNGEGSTGPDLRPLGSGDLQRIETQVRQGGAGMPAFEGVLSDDEIKAVVDFVANLQ